MPAKEITAELVQGLTRKYGRVTSLNLERNGLESIAGLHLLPDLQSLSLAGNAIVSLNDLPNLPSLTRLSLARNGIQDVPRTAFQHTPALEHLDLRGNGIDSLTRLASALSRLPHLRSLLLEGNPVCRHPGYPAALVDFLPSIETLDDTPVTTLARGPSPSASPSRGTESAARSESDTGDVDESSYASRDTATRSRESDISAESPSRSLGAGPGARGAMSMGPGAGRNATAGPGKGARRVTRAAAAWTPSPGSSLRFTDDAGDSSSEEVSGATSEGAGGVHARPMQAAPGSQERAQATGSRAVAPPVRPADASTDASSLGAWDRTRSGPSSATALGPPQATASSSGEPDTHSTWTSSDWTGDGVSRRKGPTPASSAARPDPPHTHRTPAKGGVRLPATSPQGTRGADSTERSVDRAAGTVAAADLLRRIRRAVALHRSTDTAEGRSQPGGSLRESKESEAGAESSSGAAGLRGWLHAGAGVADAAKGPVQGDGATRQELQEIWDLLRSSAEGAAALGGGDGLGRDAEEDVLREILSELRSAPSLPQSPPPELPASLLASTEGSELRDLRDGIRDLVERVSRVEASVSAARLTRDAMRWEALRGPEPASLPPPGQGLMPGSGSQPGQIAGPGLPSWHHGASPAFQGVSRGLTTDGSVPIPHASLSTTPPAAGAPLGQGFTWHGLDAARVLGPGAAQVTSSWAAFGRGQFVHGTAPMPLTASGPLWVAATPQSESAVPAPPAGWLGAREAAVQTCKTESRTRDLQESIGAAKAGSEAGLSRAEADGSLASGPPSPSKEGAGEGAMEPGTVSDVRDSGAGSRVHSAGSVGQGGSHGVAAGAVTPASPGDVPVQNDAEARALGASSRKAEGSASRSRGHSRVEMGVQCTAGSVASSLESGFTSGWDVEGDACQSNDGPTDVPGAGASRGGRLGVRDTPGTTVESSSRKPDDSAAAMTWTPSVVTGTAPSLPCDGSPARPSTGADRDEARPDPQAGRLRAAGSHSHPLTPMSVSPVVEPSAVGRQAASGGPGSPRRALDRGFEAWGAEPASLGTVSGTSFGARDGEAGTAQSERHPDGTHASMSDVPSSAPTPSGLSALWEECLFLRQRCRELELRGASGVHGDTSVVSAAAGRDKGSVSRGSRDRLEVSLAESQGLVRPGVGAEGPGAAGGEQVSLLLARNARLEAQLRAAEELLAQAEEALFLRGDHAPADAATRSGAGNDQAAAAAAAERLAQVEAERDELRARVVQAEAMLADAEGRAAAAEARAAEAEAKVADVASRASACDARAAEAEAVAADAESRAAEAEIRAAEADSRAAVAEAKAAEAVTRVAASDSRAAEADVRAASAVERASQAEERARKAEVDRDGAGHSASEALARAEAAEGRAAQAEAGARVLVPKFTALASLVERQQKLLASADAAVQRATASATFAARRVVTLGTILCPEQDELAACTAGSVPQSTCGIQGDIQDAPNVVGPSLRAPAASSSVREASQSLSMSVVQRAWEAEAHRLQAERGALVAQLRATETHSRHAERDLAAALAELRDAAALSAQLVREKGELVARLEEAARQTQEAQRAVAGGSQKVEAAARESEESLRKELAAVQAALSDAQRERRAAEERAAEVSRRDAERAREGEARAEELARRLATCEDSLTSLRREREALVALLSALQQRGPRAGMHEEAGSDEDLQGGPEGGRGPVEGLGSKPLGDHWAGAATVHARATGEKDGAGAGRPALPAPRPGVLPPGLLERVRALELLGAEMGFAHFGQSC